jgi:hypothetical protein
MSTLALLLYMNIFGDRRPSLHSDVERRITTAVVLEENESSLPPDVELGITKPGLLEEKDSAAPLESKTTSSSPGPTKRFLRLRGCRDRVLRWWRLKDRKEKWLFCQLVFVGIGTLLVRKPWPGANWVLTVGSTDFRCSYRGCCDQSFHRG